MAGSPKKDRKGLKLRKKIFRLIYGIFVLLAILCVYRSLQPMSRIPVNTVKSRTFSEGNLPVGPIGRMDFEFNEDLRTAMYHKEGLHAKEIKWAEKPSSLCFGNGEITILSVAVDLPQAYVVQMRLNRLRYITKHKYRYCEVSTNLDYFRPIAWTKVRAMLLVLSFSSTVVHMDADALVANMSLTFESIISLPQYNATGKDVIYTMDFKPGREAEPSITALINTGVYIMHSTPWSKDFLEVQYRFYRSSIHHKFWDQDAVMLYRIKNSRDFAQHVALIPYRYMNIPCSHKYNDYQMGDFIVHYAGGHDPRKYEKLVQLLTATH